jgi:hypothetical protein
MRKYFNHSINGVHLPDLSCNGTAFLSPAMYISRSHDLVGPQVNMWLINLPNARKVGSKFFAIVYTLYRDFAGQSGIT